MLRLEISRNTRFTGSRFRHFQAYARVKLHRISFTFSHDSFNE